MTERGLRRAAVVAYDAVADTASWATAYAKAYRRQLAAGGACITLAAVLFATGGVWAQVMAAVTMAASALASGIWIGWQHGDEHRTQLQARLDAERAALASLTVRYRDLAAQLDQVGRDRQSAESRALAWRASSDRAVTELSELRAGLLALAEEWAPLVPTVPELFVRSLRDLAEGGERGDRS